MLRAVTSATRALEAHAIGRGASGARVIDPSLVVVRDELAEICREPGCPSYGLSASCPPHVGGPGAMRELLARSGGALVVVLEVPTPSLLGEERHEVFRLLHEVVSSAEALARELGLGEARAFAGGSCKLLFCEGEAGCAALDDPAACRHPEVARPSMSGFGVDVTRLVEAVSFEMRRAIREDGSAGEGTSPVVGLLLF